MANGINLSGIAGYSKKRIFNKRDEYQLTTTWHDLNLKKPCRARFLCPTFPSSNIATVFRFATIVSSSNAMMSGNDKAVAVARQGLMRMEGNAGYQKHTR
jgi:hypothetical protein